MRRFYGKSSNPIKSCVLCLFRVGFGFGTVGRITGVNKSLAGRWIRKAGFKERNIKKVANSYGFRYPNQLKSHSVLWKPKAFKSEAEKLVLAEYRREIRAALRPERIWGEIEWRRRKKALASKKRFGNDPNYRALFYARKRVRQFCKVSRMRKGFSATRAIGCSPQFLREYLQSQFKAGMDWSNHGSVWQIDHIVPLAMARGNTQRLAELSHYTNLQPLFTAENRRKSANFFILGSF